MSSTHHLRRRDFVKSLGAAVAGAAVLGHSVKARGGEFTGRIKKAVKFGMINEKLSVADKFRLLADLGYDGVEVGYGDKVDPAEVARASESTGFPVHGVVLGSVHGITKAVDRAVMYGASSVLLVAGRVNAETPYAVNYQKTQALIREAVSHAEDKKILLLLENVWNNFLLSPLEMARYVDELKSPWVHVYFDIGNVARFGWPAHWIPILGKRIKKLDIKEYSRTKQMEEGPWKGFNVKIGDGEIDWSGVRRELAEIGYSGWATAEVSGGNRERLADISRRMDRVLDL